MTTDIAFLNPPNIDEPPLDATAPRLGVLYMSSLLRASGFNPVVVNLFGLTNWNEVEQKVSSLDAPVIGISCYTEQRKSAIHLARIVKELKPRTIVILGGPHATFLDTIIMDKLPFVDYVVRGEGENAVLQLLQYLNGMSNLTPDQLSGVTYRHSGAVVRSSGISVVQDLDSLPYPDYDLRYLDQYTESPRINVHFLIEEQYCKNAIVPLVSSRGCAIGCSFCCASAFWGHSQRLRSPQSIVAEIEYLKSTYGIKYFDFLDDNFTYDVARVAQFCDLVSKKRLDVRWWCSGRVTEANLDLYKRMKAAGCFLVSLGMESGSDKLLRRMGKQIKTDDIIRAATLAREAHLPFRVTVTVGHLGETESTINQTIQLLRQIRPKQIGLFLVELFPGTPLYKIAKRRGFVDDAYWFLDDSEPFLFNLVEYRLDELLDYRNRIVDSLQDRIQHVHEDTNYDMSLILNDNLSY